MEETPEVGMVSDRNRGDSESHCYHLQNSVLCFFFKDVKDKIFIFSLDLLRHLLLIKKRNNF